MAEKARTRMQEFADLHERLRVENELAKKNAIQSSLITSTLENLKKIDSKYFLAKVGEFDKKYQINKIYLDQDRTGKLVSEEMKYEIRKLSSELKGLDNTEADKLLDAMKPTEVDVQNYRLSHPRSVEYNKELLMVTKEFNDNVNAYKAKRKVNTKRFTDDVNMAQVEQFRNQHPNDEIELLQKGHANGIRKAKEVDRTYKALIDPKGLRRKLDPRKLKFYIFFGVMLAIILICILIPAFI